MGNACICGKNDGSTSNRNRIIKNQTKEEELYKPVSTKISNKVMKAICRIIIKINEDISYETGFFIKISKALKYIFLNYPIINPGENIELQLWNKEKINLKISDYNCKYFEKPKDITIIELKDFDQKYYDIEFLDYDYNYIKGYNMYKNMDVFSLKHPFESEALCVNGLILNINSCKFIHNISIEKDSSGCPIILFNNYINLVQVIGIHKNTFNEKGMNKGIFIGEIIYEIKNDSGVFTNKFLNIKNELKMDLINLSKEDASKNSDNIILKIQQENINEKDKINIKSIKKNITQKKNNYIVSEIYIKNEDINKPIRIINSYEEYKKYLGYNSKYLQKELMNEGEIKECEIRINDKLIQFNYFYSFTKKGKYIIIYKFKNLLTKTNNMFYECSSLINIDLSNFNAKNVTDMRQMFYQCSSLQNIDLSDFNAQNITNMSHMFCNCSSLQKLDLSHLDTQRVNDISCMLSGCSSLIEVNLTKFNTQNVIYMNHLFSFCSSLKNIDLSNFFFQNVTFMCCIF